MRTHYDLAALVKQQARPRRNAEPRPIHPPSQFERSARRLTLHLIAAWASELRNVILPAYVASLSKLTKDEAGDDVSTAMRGAMGRMTRVVFAIEHGLNQWTANLEQWHRSRFAEGIKVTTSVDVFPFISSADMQDEIDAILQRHSSLIRGLNDQLRQRVEETIWREFVNQTPRREIAKMLTEQLDIGKSRAELIARDQTSKLASELNRLRQTQAGIDQYKWRHSGKVNFRPEHKAREGKIYSWDDPPHDGHPGDAINCGCTAQAYIELMDEEEDEAA